MTQATNFLSRAILQALFGRTSAFGAYTTPPDLHLGASTSTPTQAGANFTEPVGNAYARLDLTSALFNDATLADPSIIDNSSSLTFPTATGSWGTLTHLGMFDAASGGNLMIIYPLTASRQIDTNDTLSVAAGDLDTQLT